MALKPCKSAVVSVFLAPGLSFLISLHVIHWPPCASHASPLIRRSDFDAGFESARSSFASSSITDYDPDHPLLTVIQPQNQPLVKNLRDPSVRAFDIPGNSTLHLKCTGSRELVWSFPQNHPVSDVFQSPGAHSCLRSGCSCVAQFPES